VLRAFRDAGGRLMVDDLTDLAVRPESLAAFGIRYIRTDAARLAAAIEAETTASDIHVQDLPSLFQRRGIEFVIGGVASDKQLANLGEIGPVLAQGALFGDWRMVRDDLLAAPQPAAMQDNTQSPAPAAKPVAAEPAAANTAQRVPFRSLLRRA
jgi:EAL domain-containing protein (putative c-di-GMP-specific phosphodiesterase class I)